MSKKLMAHQELILDIMDATPYFGIFAKPGTGKTIVALTWIVRALRSGRIRDALVICPASLVPNWEKDIAEADQFDHISKDDVRLMQEKVVIRSFQKLYHSSTNKYSGSRMHILREDIDKYWGAIFIDESQALGNHSSAQTKVCLKMAEYSDYRYIMSGTPIHGSTKTGGEDMQKLYGQLKFLKPSLWKNWTQWSNMYVAAVDKFYKPIAYRKEPLYKLMEEMAITIRLEDCVDLPDGVRTMVPCPLAVPKDYKFLKEGDTARYNIEIKTAGGQGTKMLQLCSGSMKDDDQNVLDFACSKDTALIDLLTGTDDKVIIFCLYTASVARCARLAAKAGRSPVIFDGNTTTATWKSFVDGRADVLVTQYQKGSRGLNLQSSHTTIYFEPCMSTEQLDQSFARTRRTGQAETCRYVFLYTPSTVEELALNSVLNGEDVVEETFRRWAETGRI